MVASKGGLAKFKGSITLRKITHVKFPEATINLNKYYVKLRNRASIVLFYNVLRVNFNFK